MKKPKFHVGAIVPVEYLVDRTNEMKKAIAILVAQKGNLLIVGNRKIGKSSLAGKINNELNKQKILCVNINLLTYDRNPNDFLKEILLLICYEVGGKIFKKSTADLLSSFGKENPKGEYGRFFKIYKLARSISISQSSNSSMDASVSAFGTGVKGAKNYQEQISTNGLQPYEFIKLTEELVEICKSSGFQSVVIIADEANQLARDVSVELLQSYFEILKSKQIQFIFVAEKSILEFPSITSLFEDAIELTGFDGIEDIHELLKRYFKTQTGIDYTEAITVNAIKQIWEISKGNPWFVQLICDASIDNALAENSDKVEEKHVLLAWANKISKNSNLMTFWA